MDVVKIPLSKTKLLFGIGASILFVFPGFYLFETVSEKYEIIYKDFVKTLGIVCIVFFGFIAIYCVRKLFDKKPGLRIDEKGITDNTSAVSVGFIAWEDVVDISTTQVTLTKMLLVYIKNTDAYLAKGNKVKQQFMKGNMKMYGTPVVIAATSLKCNFSNLEEVVKKKFRQRLTGQYK